MAENYRTFQCDLTKGCDKPVFLANCLFCCISGDALIAKNVKNKVFSFDLVSRDPSVVACDMSNVCSGVK